MQSAINQNKNMPGNTLFQERIRSATMARRTEQHNAIVHTIKKHYPLSPDCEITVESTISEITPELCTDLKEAGVNRISLGVQSFNTEIR